MAKTVVVGMSGGVDSSVAAALLKEQGFEVIGLFMHNWEEQVEGECTSAADFNDALAVSASLGIPCYSVNFAKQYMERVFTHFLEEYKKGRTPNPDVLCNREIKFGPFREHAAKMGADFVATGHYCGVRQENGTNFLIKAADEDKDQTYFLNQVRTSQLDNVLFPLAGMQKGAVRTAADRLGLVTAKKKDSTGICFIGERKFRLFLEGYLPAQEGDIRDTAGAMVGRHGGLMYYTLGQRRGLGIGGIKDEKNARWYVVSKDLKTNTLIVSCGEGEELLSNGLFASGFNWIGAPVFAETLLNSNPSAQINSQVTTNSGFQVCSQTATNPSAPLKEFECMAKFRYRQGEQAVKVTVGEENVRIDFAERQRAVTPGQYAVLYKGDRCLGGGVIDSTF